MDHAKHQGGHKKLSSLGATTMALSLLTGCASHAPQAQKPDEAKVKQFTGRGYLTDDRYNVTASFATWIVGDRKFDIAFTVPTKAGPYPLLIYLPGLGEGRSAGESLRTFLAQAGYAVMSIQPLAEDANAWSSSAARAGDFSALAHERYSAAAMTARFDALRALLGELQRRPHGESPLDRIDLTQTAIIGYDLGAYAAMILAGEEPRGIAKPALPITIKAAVALSPYSSFSGAAFADRYGKIAQPVLSITSDSDADALGLVTSPSLRKAPFQYMPPGGKFLLTLSDLSHASIGGSEANEINGGTHPTHPSGASDAGRQQGGGKHGGRGHGHDGGEDQSSDNGLDSEISQGGMGAHVSPTARAIGIAAIQGVTIAFLDAYVKNDGFAQEWLDKDARRWLGDRGEMQRK